MNTKEEILDFLTQNRKLLTTKYHISKIGLFGSFSRDEQNNSSDVDLLIELDKNSTNIYDLKLSINKFLSDAFDRDVDLAREKYLKPYAREQILKETLFV